MIVRSLLTRFGTDAGKIWKELGENGPQNEEELIKKTKLKKSDFFAGLGWLAREDKISKEGNDSYQLGVTNLTSEIGVNAGRVWKILDIWGEVNISTIKRLAEIDDKEAYSALGWLAREDKICIVKSNRYYLK
jgi:hypothetical protein